MSVRDFPPRPQGAAPDSVPYQNWLDALGQRQNIDLLQVASSLPTGAKVPIFDPTETGQNKTKAIDASLIGGGITGPGSSTDNAVARWDGTGGDTLQDSAFIVDNSGNVSSFGGQITFPATQSASSNANTLDDYEEGTWTPADASGAGLSFGSVTGIYTKIGNMVNASCALTYPATASGASALISGLPFTVRNTEAARQGTATYTNNSGGMTSTLPSAGGTTIQFATAAGGGITNANLSGSINYLQYIYFT